MSNDTGGAAVAKNYYDSHDANTFYLKIWGGENIHVGTYKDNWSVDTVTVEDVREASIRTVKEFFDHVPSLQGVKRAADLGAGIGGNARDLCSRLSDVVVDCYEISEKENETNRQLAKRDGFQDRINVIGKSYMDTGAPNEHYDLVISQDAFLHCADRAGVMKEASRILKKGGYMVFTDPMQTDDANTDRLQPVYKRLELPGMGSPGLYKSLAAQNGLELVKWVDRAEQMKKHYASVKRILDTKGKEIGISDGYIANASQGLSHWVNGVENKDLTWGIFVFQKK